MSYDTGYDDAGRSLTAVSCSDGNNGVMWKYNWYAIPSYIPFNPTSSYLS